MNPKQLVTAYYEHFFSKQPDLPAIRAMLHEAFTFEGPLMAADSPDDYIKQLKLAGVGRLKAVIREIIADGAQVAVFYDLTTPVGILATVEWFWIDEGKIRRLKLFNDPRRLITAL